MKKHFALCLCAILLSSCKFNPAHKASVYDVAGADSLAFQMASIDTVDALCKTKFKFCPSISFIYLVFETPDSSLNIFMNKEVAKMMLYKDDSSFFSSPSSCIENYFAESRDAKKQGDYDAESSAWEVHKEVHVLPKKGKYQSLEASEFFFEGGAHPNSNTIFKTYDLILKQSLAVNELFINLRDTALLRIGEHYFRKEKQLADTAKLSDNMFFIFGDGDNFEDGPDYGKFRFNDNYALTKEGIEFYYNPYEIGPYVVGPSSFIIPYAELKPFLKLTLW